MVETHSYETGNRDCPVNKRLLGRKEWYRQGIRYWKRQDYEVIEELRVKYDISSLCAVMDVNRSDYYVWRSRRCKPNYYEQNTKLLAEAHERHKSYDYHSLAKVVFETGWVFSDNLAVSAENIVLTSIVR